MRTIEWKDGTVVIVDQTKLPNEVVWVKMTDYNAMASAIKEMKLRGAPLIGVAAAYGLALTAFHSKAETKEELLKESGRARGAPIECAYLLGSSSGLYLRLVIFFLEIFLMLSDISV